MSNLQKVTNDIRVLNKDLEALRIHFPHCFDKNGNFHLEKFKNNLAEKEINFSTESYGLDWLGKSYARLLASDPATTLLKADETHNAKPQNANSENLLIKGDNLEVLKHLANAYYEKVKMIYIDPPYNTGSDGFLYQDDRKFTVKELQQLIGVDAEKAKRILDFTQSKSNSHSAWLTFLYPRLYIAKQLLKDEGVFFISIDDNEVSQLKILMDEVFGEENFVTTLIRKGMHTVRNSSKDFNKNADFVLVYTKNKSWFENDKKHYIRAVKDKSDDYPFDDNDGRGLYKLDPLYARNFYTPYSYKFINGFEWQAPEGSYPRYSEDTLKWMEEDNRIVFSKRNEPKAKRYLSEVQEGQPPDSILKSEDVGFNSDGTKRLTLLLGSDKVFSQPKPVELVKYLCFILRDKNCVILDFFAGSGTTGDAVMQINVEDGGQRKYLLVQLPEHIDAKKNKAAYDFVKGVLKAEPTIFEITKERLIRAAKKTIETIQDKIEAKEKEITSLESRLDLEDKGEKIKQLKKEIEALQAQDLGFKIFETTPIWEDYNFEAEQFDSSQTLFDAGKLTEDDIKALLTTWKTYDGIALTQELEKVDLPLDSARKKSNSYTSYYGNGKLYLMNKGFTTDNLKTLLEKIDSDKHFNPTSIIAFGYHFDSKNLRELSENVKSYANKKNIEIDFVTRY